MSRKANCTRCDISRESGSFTGNDTFCRACRSEYNAEQYTPMTSKVCRVCEVDKPLAEFGRDGARYRNDCRRCNYLHHKPRGPRIKAEEAGRPKVYDFTPLAQHWRVNESRGDAP